MQYDGCTDRILCAACHVKFRAAVTGPVDSLCAFFIRKRINGNLVSNHKRRIKAKTEMSDNLVFVRLVLIFFQKIRSPGKSNLIDIFFDFLSCHAKAVVCNGQCFIIRVYGYLNLRLVICRKLVFAHHVQLF